jgi:AraC family transcriptional regulator of adaptative response / DNA-3-methyladenine glycosylase II
MKVTVSAYERARLSRDARFDGRFFVAVSSTGIYCRPVCPALQPKSRNIRFYDSAAAAEEAGYRPCLRCRPETAPGTPPWQGTSTTVQRALRMIHSGALDEGSLEDLSDKLGVTPRHLHRLFRQHLGASPVAVAQTRRLHRAKRLLDETELSMTQVALCAGYGSVRRFNAAFQERYSRAPRSLRKETGTKRTEPAAGYHFRLRYRPPYDWDAIIGFLTARAIPGVEQVTPLSYRRSIAVNGKAGWFEVTPSKVKHALELRIHFPDPAALYRIIERTRALFDLDAVPQEIERHLGRDKFLQKWLAAFPGLRVPGCWDGFELAVRAVLGQQVSVVGATTLSGRLVEKYGELANLGDDAPPFLFPPPEKLVRARLTGVGLTMARARTVRALAKAVAAGKLQLDFPADPEKTTAELLALPGIGDWTAQYIAMRALRDPDSFPAGDLGLQRALSHGRVIDAGKIQERTEGWRPWRAYAAMVLWKKYGTEGKKHGTKTKK